MHKRNNSFIAFILVAFLLVACGNPWSNLTNVPAAAIGIYETVKKRENWEKYAVQGDVYAQFELANSYCCHKTEGTLDPVKSFSWFCYAARNGYGKAQMVVGRLYENNQVMANLTLPQDMRKAYLWYSFAARRADMDALAKVSAIEPLLTKEDIDYVNRYNRDVRTAPCGDYKGHDKQG